MADQFDEQFTRYIAALAYEGIGVYDSCDDQRSRDIIKKFTKEIRNILAPYEFIHNISGAIWLSRYIEDIRKVLLELDGVSYDIDRSVEI